MKKTSIKIICMLIALTTFSFYQLQSQTYFSGNVAVDSVAKQIGYDFDGVHVPQNTFDNFSIAYSQFVVPLIKAVQEQQQMIDSLKESISTLINPPSNGRIMNNNGNQSGNENTQEIKLKLPVEISMSEARPNPNDGKAEIDYYLPSYVLDAKIIFTDMLGNIINEVKLTNGYGTIIIDTQDLPNGNYTFSLVSEGKVFNTKKMLKNK